jgi:hypothetical protein
MKTSYQTQVLSLTELITTVTKYSFLFALLLKTKDELWLQVNERGFLDSHYILSHVQNPNI